MEGLQACSHPSLRMLPASPNNCHQICNKAMRQALCYIRQDTATRHCGKTLRQGNTAGAAERLSGRHCGHMRQGTTAKHCGRHYGKKTPRQDTAAKIHCGTVARKCDMWQESATCVMALRHATATKPKKEGVGGGGSRRSPGFGHNGI